MYVISVVSVMIEYSGGSIWVQGLKPLLAALKINVLASLDPVIKLPARKVPEPAQKVKSARKDKLVSPRLVHVPSFQRPKLGRLQNDNKSYNKCKKNRLAASLLE